MYFQYHPSVLEQNPDTCGGAIYLTGTKNGPSPESLQVRYRDEQAATLARIQTPLSEVPSLAAWRQAFRRFGAKPTKHRSAAEALLRRLTKKGDIPSINLLVDMGNLISIRYALPVAFFDIRDVTGGITVCHANGSERFTELGSDDVLHPEVGEVIFADEREMVIARRWCWRQSAESAARNDTSDVLVTVESQQPESESTIAQAVDDLLALIGQYTDGHSQDAIVRRDHPRMDVTR